MAARFIREGGDAAAVRRSRERRGVLLLVVLSLLVLFSIIGLTFVLIAGHFRRTTRSEVIGSQFTRDPRQQIESLALDVMRGTSILQSPIQHHGLLEDMYGPPTLTGYLGFGNNTTTKANPQMVGAVVYPNSQFLDLMVTSNGTDLTPSHPLSYLAYGAFNGQVLTMLSGPAQGMSTRIVGSCYAGTSTIADGNGVTTRVLYSFILRVVAFDNVTSANFINISNDNAYYNLNMRFVINGRPFSGTGFGYNTNPSGGSTDANGNPQAFPRASGAFTMLDATDANGFYYALMPNAKYFPLNMAASTSSPPPPPVNPFYTLPPVSPSASPTYYPPGATVDYMPMGLHYDPAGPGGANEDYDAPDPQNMVMAYQPVGVQNYSQIIPSFHRPDLVQWYRTNTTQKITPAGSSTPIPISQAWTSNIGNIQEKVILRPLTADHPMFTGGNPSFDPVAGPWDVDNDGDGIPDSIWIDPGYPIQTTPGGQQYKTLVSYLVLDMDGRLNVNAHGNISQTQAFVPDPNTGGDLLNSSYSQGPYAFLTNSGGGSGSNGPAAGSTSANQSNPVQNLAQLPRGMGYGPAEINPGYGLSATGGGSGASTNPIFGSMQQYLQLMTGIQQSGVPPYQAYDGRYGELNATPTPLPGSTTTMNSSDDIQCQIKEFDLPFGPISGSTNTLYQQYAGTTVSYFQSVFTPANPIIPLTSYGTPSDFWGRMSTGLDFRGQPLFLFPNTASFSPYVNALSWETPNNPYALNLLRPSVRLAMQQGSPIDNPYTMAELERFLRRFDLDGYTLPDRLRAIIEDSGGQTVYRPIQAERQLITTDSYDVASPSVIPPTEMRQSLVTEATAAGGKTVQNAAPQYAPLRLNIADLLRAKLLMINPSTGQPNINAYFPGFTSATLVDQAAAVNSQLVMMLPPELAAGQMFNLNRPFGNGRDDNGNNAVDEPQEYMANPVYHEPAWANNITGGSLFPAVGGKLSFLLDDFIDSNNDDTTATPSDSASYASVAALYGAGIPYTPRLFARQLYARHLYVLMMLLVDQGYVQPGPSAGQYPGLNLPTPSNQWATGVTWNNYGVNSQESGITPAIQQELTARRIAQWAINVVEFRDPDGIMTPFEYDVNPFNGWNVDGIADTVENSTGVTTKYKDMWGNPMLGTKVGNNGDPNGERRIVWGCEHPELMITETFATHDRRVRDAKVDTSFPAGTQQPNHPRYVYNPALTPPWQPTDPSMDQIRIPEGSLFVELYCPRPANGAPSALPGDLYNYGPNGPQLNLGKVCADGVNPVWRLVITGSTRQSQLATGNANSSNIYQRMQTNPVTTNLDPPDGTYNVAAGTMTSHNFSIWSQNPYYPMTSGYGPATIDRIVWLSGPGAGGSAAPAYSAETTPNYANIFYNQGTTQNGTALMSPGTYAVVGPRPLTVFGRKQNVGFSPTPVLADYPSGQLPPLSPQGIQILPAVSYTSTNGTVGTPAPSYPTVGNNIQPVLGIVCGSHLPTTPLIYSTAKKPAAIPWAGGASLNHSTHNASLAMAGPGLSISEPLYPWYYIEPTHADSAVQTVFPSLNDSYGVDSGSGTTTTGFLDQPFETSVTPPNVAVPATYPGVAEGIPLVSDIVLGLGRPLGSGTIPQYKTVVLQRLANPYLAYNPMPNDPNDASYSDTLPVNPYISIDWMPVNLTIFNGEQIPVGDPTSGGIAGPPTLSIDPDEATSGFWSGALAQSGPQPGPPFGPLAINGVYFPPAAGNAGSFCTTQRGVTNTTGSQNQISDVNIWPQWFDLFPPNGCAARGANNLVFDWSLDNVPTASAQSPAYYGHTLGYLNRAFLGNGSNFGPPWSGANGMFIGDPNPSHWLSSGGGSSVVNRTIPWIPWNNRPYVSHYELMQVPASSAGRLMWEFGFSGSQSLQVQGTNPPNPYDATTNTPSTAGNPSPFLAPFMHLLNFELSTSASSVRTNDNGVAPHFYRLFDYVRVPSRFVGTETWFNPNVTTSQLAEYQPAGAPAVAALAPAVESGVYKNLTSSAAANLEKALFSYPHPPFNSVSKHRDPGKVNINTIAHQPSDSNPIIWNAIVNGAPVASGSAQTLNGPLWSSVSASIHNSQAPYASGGSGQTPSWFANPFRSATGADLQLPPGLPLRGVDVTLLRPFGTVASGGATGNQNPYLLFDFPPAELSGSASTLVQAHNAPDRNSYFRYQNLQRMGNLVTTRSNVYAIWVTIGYFRVQPWTYATANGVVTGADYLHPDGVQLAEELGSDMGTAERHRAFYVFDRSIPVGAERGVNHNIDRAILIKRFIE